MGLWVQVQGDVQASSALAHLLASAMHQSIRCAGNKHDGAFSRVVSMSSLQQEEETQPTMQHRGS